MSASYYPATNCLVERAVQTFKELWRGEETEERWYTDEPARFLFSYHIAQQITTGVTPTELSWDENWYLFLT